MAQTEHRVFISYATPDRAAADRVCGSLETAGVSCWIAARDIEPGTIFPATIVDALNAAQAMVLILTEHAVASPHVLSEVGYAFNAKKRILPFRLSRADLTDELEYYLSLTQWLDAPEGCTEENLKRLIDATLDCLAGKAPASRGREPRRRIWSFVALVAALAAAAGGATYWAWSTRDAATTGREAPVTDSSGPRGGAPAAPERKTWLNPEDGQTYVWIPPGMFAMGCSPADAQCRDNEQPVRQVRIERGFWLGQTEVTGAALRKVAAKQGMKVPARDDDLPVADVTWAEAKKFCGAVGGRLPTEAEWEHAARAGSSQAHYGVPREIAQYGDEARRFPHPVRTKAPNAFGLYDMLGNVSEWVLDRYYNRYDPEAPATGPEVTQPLASNASAIARGGSWAGDVASLRVSRRIGMEPDAADGRVGFRCARDAVRDGETSQNPATTPRRTASSGTRSRAASRSSPRTSSSRSTTV